MIYNVLDITSLYHNYVEVGGRTWEQLVASASRAHRAYFQEQDYHE